MLDSGESENTMKIRKTVVHKGKDTETLVLVELTETEAKSLCSDLSDVSPYRTSDRALLQGVIDGIRETLKPEITAAEAAVEVEAAADGLRHEDDKADMRVIAWALRRNDRALATRVAQNMDTAVRDEIPRVAWPFCGLRAL